MNRYFIFILRFFLGLTFAIVLTRMFHPEKGLGFIAGIAVVLVALSYFFSFMRTRGRKE